MPFRLALVDLPHRFGPAPDRFAALDHALGAVAGADLAIFAARAFTGAVAADGATDLRAAAEPLGGPTLDAVKSAARKWNSTLGVPLIERAGREAYESYVVVAPTGKVLAHVRRATPDATSGWVKPGAPAGAAFKLGDVRCAVSIEPTPEAVQAALGSSLRRLDLLIWPTVWTGDDDARRSAVASLAAGSGLFVANANWGRGEPAIRGQGGPILSGPDGLPVPLIRYAGLTELALPDFARTRRRSPG